MEAGRGTPAWAQYRSAIRSQKFRSLAAIPSTTLSLRMSHGVAVTPELLASVTSSLIRSVIAGDFMSACVCLGSSPNAAITSATSSLASNSFGTCRANRASCAFQKPSFPR